MPNITGRTPPGCPSREIKVGREHNASDPLADVSARTFARAAAAIIQVPENVLILIWHPHYTNV